MVIFPFSLTLFINSQDFLMKSFCASPLVNVQFNLEQLFFAESYVKHNWLMIKYLDITMQEIIMLSNIKEIFDSFMHAVLI